MRRTKPRIIPVEYDTLKHEASLRVGSNLGVIGRASPTGLGSMSLDFCREMRPQQSIIIDTGGIEYDTSTIADLPHEVVPVKKWRAGNVPLNFQSSGVKAVFGFETFYHDSYFALFRDQGIKTIIVPNWEWSPAAVQSADLVICCSDTDWHFYRGLVPEERLVRKDWPVEPPSNFEEGRRYSKWPPRTFVHAAGEAYGNDRNKTSVVLAASKWLIGTDARLVVYSRGPLTFPVPQDAPVEIRGSVADRWELFKNADCFIHPMSYGGIAMPLREAMSSGIPTITTDLPESHAWNDVYRIPVEGWQSMRTATRIRQAVISAETLGPLMRALALGEIERKEPPKPPTWAEWREWWATDEKVQALFNGN